MRQIISNSTVVKRLFLLVLCAALFSFSNKPGGDSFEIYVNNKLVLQDYLHGRKDVPSFSLSRNSEQDQMFVNYGHCGKMGTARNIIIKDEQNKVLKEWHFPDAPGDQKSPMVLKVKDIVAVSGGRNTLNLFYSSKELSDGQILASINLIKENKTALNQ